MARAFGLLLPLAVLCTAEGRPDEHLAALGDPHTQRYSYSNLFDGQLRREAGFSEFEMLQAVEEALSLWAQVIPVTFLEQADTGPAPSDTQYLQQGHADIRLGHHAFSGTTLAHAYFPGTGGLAGDVHVDSSDRVWSESLFLTTITHELGHALGLDHFDAQTAIMNTNLGGKNMISQLGLGFLFQADIQAAQEQWGVGQGKVLAHRTWEPTRGVQWSTHANWDRGFRPTRHASVLIDRDARVEVTQADQLADSVTFGVGTNRLIMKPGGSLSIANDLVLGSAQGGQPLVAAGSHAQAWVPENGTLAARWIEPVFDDSNWTPVELGLGYDQSEGYEPLIATDLGADLFNRNGTVYTRAVFDLADPASLDVLTLRMKYDDGFVAWLNGVPVAAANAPANPRWNSLARGPRDESQAYTFADFDLSSHLPVLRPGRNVLAIQGLNHRPDSSDLLIAPALLAGPIDNRLTVDGGRLIVGGDLKMGTAAGSQTQVEVNRGQLQVRGQIERGDGAAQLIVNGGTLRIDSAAPGQTLLDEQSPARILVPTDNRLSEDWTAAGFDDSSWQTSPAAIGYERDSGYEHLIAGDVEQSMYQINGSIYSRIPFQVLDPASIDQLQLDVQFDDGFVAYLNGRQVALSHAPQQTSWDSTAAGVRDDHQARYFQTFDLTSQLDALVPGTNVLALHGLNGSTNSSDFLLAPRLTAHTLAGLVEVDVLHFSGGQMEGLQFLDGRLEHHAGVLSPSRPGRDDGSIGLLTIRGHYQMQPEAHLRLDIESAGHDTLLVQGPAVLAGTLQIASPTPLADLEPRQRGEARQWVLLTASQIEGQFDQLQYAQQPLVLGHQGQGLFRQLVYREQDVSLRHYLAVPGDATGDGRFDSRDLLQVFQRGQYEDRVAGNSDWTGGDWSGDGDFDSADLILALQRGSFQGNATAPPHAVPEAGPLAASACLLVIWWARRRREPV